jgi:hypothetical protein
MLPPAGDGGRPEPVFDTGDPDDDEVLRQLALRGPIDAPRHWVHFLPCRDETAARAVAGQVAAAGWTVQVAGKRRDWHVVAERSGAVVSAEAVRQARLFFERVASGVPGASYDGWHASA